MKVLFVAIALVISCGASVVRSDTIGAPGSNSARSALELIACTVKSRIEHLSAEQVRKSMALRYQNLRLMDAQGVWSVPGLRAHAKTLLPDRLDGKCLCRFVDLMADTASANPYLMNFLDRARGHEFRRLREKVQTEGATVFPEVMAHAEVLDRLTTVMIDDAVVSEACRAEWRRIATSDPGYWTAQSFFARLKTRSVNLGLDRVYRSLREGKANPRSLAIILPLNILEAVGADLFLAVVDSREARAGHLANARAGLALARHGPQGAGPNRITVDGKLLEIQPRNVKEWDDLYATWNMSFITIVDRWPFFLAKLVIPSVNDYADEPGSYINRRALALEIQMYTNGLERLSGEQTPVDWTDPELRAVWGKTNLESARDYARKARSAVH